MLSIIARSTIELAAILLLIYGFIHEDKVIEFEQTVKMVAVVMFKRYKKKKAIEKMQKNRDFRVIDGKKSSSNKSGKKVSVA